MSMKREGDLQPLGETLRVFGVTQEELERALARARETGDRIGEVLVELGSVTEEELEVALAMQRSERRNGSRDRHAVRDVLRAMDYAICRAQRATRSAIRVQRITGRFKIVGGSGE